MYVCTMYVFGEQGWRSGDRAFLPPMWPGFDSWTRCHKWVEFVVGSCPCSKGFSPGSLVFLPPKKSKREFEVHECFSRMTVMCNPRKNKVDLFIYLFYLFI